ncbi:MAG: hypothetical protein AB1403_07655 [Candidatus Riflebacteria bacterium]
MSGIRFYLEELKKELQSDLKTTVDEAREQVETTLTLIDKLLTEGKIDEANVSFETLDDIFEESIKNIFSNSKKSLINYAKDKIKEAIENKIKIPLEQKLIAIIGPLGGTVVSIAIQLLQSIKLERYRRININSLVTEENQNLLAKVIAFSASVEKHFMEFSNDMKLCLGFYKKMQPHRDKLLSMVLGAACLDKKTKKEIFQFQRQSHVLTPGQRNLLQDATDMLEASISSKKSTDDQIDQELGSILTGETRALVISNTNEQEKIAEKIIAGLAKHYDKVWNSWFPKDLGSETRLGKSLEEFV